MDRMRMLKAIDEFMMKYPATEEEVIALLEREGDRKTTGKPLDMLEDIFERNKRFTDFARANAPRTDMPEEELEEKKAKEVMFLRNCIAMFSEVVEYTNEGPWKWWGRGRWQMNREKALEELVDLLHFFMIAVDDLGFSAKDIYEAYVKKNNHNWRRFREKIGWGQTDKEHQDSP